MPRDERTSVNDLAPLSSNSISDRKSINHTLVPSPLVPHPAPTTGSVSASPSLASASAPSSSLHIAASSTPASPLKHDYANAAKQLDDTASTGSGTVKGDSRGSGSARGSGTSNGGRFCHSCTSAADSLSAFLAAYQPPAVILYRGAPAPVQENGAFLKLRTAHLGLLKALVAAVNQGRKRVCTTVENRRIRWTITMQPSSVGQSRRATVLGGEEDGEDEDEELDLSENDDIEHDAYKQDSDDDDDDTESPTIKHSSPKRTPSHQSGSLSATQHLAPPRTTSTSPNPRPLTPLTSAAIPRAPTPDRAWLLDARFSAIASGGGEMGELIRTLDWSYTALGSVPSWCPTLLSTVGLLLHTEFPGAIYWGPTGIMLYNSAYIFTLGVGKHPWALGRPIRDVWAETWEALSVPVADALEGKGCYYEDQQFLILRSGTDADANASPNSEGEVQTPPLDDMRNEREILSSSPSLSPSPSLPSSPSTPGSERDFDPLATVSRIEEAYFTWSFIPLHQPSGAIGGIYNPVHEVTSKVLSERRLRTLCTLATRLFAARTNAGLLVDTCEVLGQLEEDVPYVAAYAVQGDEFVGGEGNRNNYGSNTEQKPLQDGPVTFILQETVGIPFDAPAAPSKLVVDPLSPNPSPSKWPIDLRSLVSQRELLIHNNVSHLLSSLPPRGNASSLPTRAATLPIVHGGELVGLLLIFLNGALPLDERMLIFLDLLGRQVSTSASMVASYEGELAKLEEMGALDRAKTAFFTNISHELRTPLTLILGPVGQLIEGLPAEGSATGTVLATGAGAGAGAGAGSAIAVANANASLGSGARAQLGIVERNARRLLRLVNTIMDFATAEAGRTTSTFVPTLLASFTADLASAFRSAAALGGLAYSVDVNEVPSGLMVYVDRDKYEKVVYNLLSNAVKYTLKGKVQVRVYIGDGDGGGGMDKGAGAGARDSASRGVAVKGERFVLEISDTGVGIPSNELGSVFDKFHRASTGQTQSQSQGQGSTGGGGQGQGRSIEGTGIGLAYTLELVKAHKGEVTVQSMPGEGSTFKIHLPLGKDHLPPGSVMEIEVPDQGEVGEWGSGGMTPSASSTSVSEVGHTGGRYMDELAQMVPPSEAETTSESLMSSSAVLWQPLIFGDRERARIMVADDNADMRRYVASLLTRYCDVHTVADGAKALAELQERRMDYDLILSDDMMPNMTGSELLDAIRADATLRTIPFIMISAKAGDEARMGGLARGADDYLSKPFKAKELLLRVHTQLQSASVRNELETRMAAHLRSLEESRESFTRLCERLQVGIHRSDSSGALLWVNRKWSHTMGLRDGEWERWEEALHPEDLGRAVEGYRGAIKSKSGYEQPLELRVRDVAEKGEYVDVIYDLQPEFASDASGELLGWVGVWSDVTALRRLQRLSVEAERAHAREAERNRELQEQFIDITCHELRNPLNAIYNSAALLGESLSRIEASLSALRERDGGAFAEQPEFEKIDAELQEDIDSANTIVLCAKHQKRITDDVLNVSKLSAGLITLVTAAFSPYEEVKNTVRMFRDEVSARGLTMEFERDPSLDALHVDRVRGDSGRFVQVVVNLLSNAIKFTETAPRHHVRIRIGATEHREDISAWPEMAQDDLTPMCRAAPADPHTSYIRIYVAVEDSGHGMTEDEQERVFQRFAQASPRTYGEFGGHGLGLYVSRMLVELHGGKIHLQSARGVGTVMRFFIVVERSKNEGSAPLTTPLIEFDSQPLGTPAPATFQPPIAGPPNPRLRVLVVEDNLINQRLLVKLLTILQCDTHTCKDGQECVDLLQGLGQPSLPNFDIILMDLEMPILDGLGATRRIRELEQEGVLAFSRPIVAVSGNARSEWTDRARDAGMDGFLRKPYNKAELQELLDRWRSGQRGAGTS